MRCLRKVRCAIFAPCLAQQKASAVKTNANTPSWLRVQADIQTKDTLEEGLNSQFLLNPPILSSLSRNQSRSRACGIFFFYATCVTWPKSATSLSQRKKKTRKGKTGGRNRARTKHHSFNGSRFESSHTASFFLNHTHTHGLNTEMRRERRGKYNDCTPASISPAQNAQSAIYNEAAQNPYKIKTSYSAPNPLLFTNKKSRTHLGLILGHICKKKKPQIV